MKYTIAEGAGSPARVYRTEDECERLYAQRWAPTVLYRTDDYRDAVDFLRCIRENRRAEAARERSVRRWAREARRAERRKPRSGKLWGTDQ